MKYHVYKWNRESKDNEIGYEDTWTYQGVQEITLEMGITTTGFLNGDRFHSIYSLKIKSDYTEINGFLIDNHTVCNIRCYSTKPKLDILTE